MVGSETIWAKEKREQRKKQKLLTGQCPENVLTEIDIEKEIVMMVVNNRKLKTDN